MGRQMGDRPAEQGGFHNDFAGLLSTDLIVIVIWRLIVMAIH